MYTLLQLIGVALLVVPQYRLAKQKLPLGFRYHGAQLIGALLIGLAGSPLNPGPWIFSLLWICASLRGLILWLGYDAYHRSRLARIKERSLPRQRRLLRTAPGG